MKRLIEAFRELLADAARCDGDLARTADKALRSVDWSADPHQPEPQSHPAVDAYLATAIVQSGAPATASRNLAEALAEAADRIRWRAPASIQSAGPERAAFSRRHTAARIVGENGFLHSSGIIAGLTVQAPDTYYPPHAHTAEESYWVIGGQGEWKVDCGSWFPVGPGDGIYHRSEAHHTMATREHPMLSVWLWTSHLESEVRIVGPWQR